MIKSERRKFIIEGLKNTVLKNADDIDPCYISSKQVARFLGYSDSSHIRQFVHGCHKIGNKYLILDVAENILELGRI